jgi:hypothetical protein
MTDNNRKMRIKFAEKIKNKQRLKFRYDPADKNEKFNPQEYKFENISGNLINNINHKIINIKT